MRIGRTEKNYAVDVVIGFLFIATTFSWKNYLTHIILGFTLLIALVVHVWLHKEWTMHQAILIIKKTRRRFESMTQVNFLVDLIIGMMFIVSIVSGLVMIVYESVVWGGLHSFSSWMVFLGFLIHILLHFTWIVEITRKLITERIKRQKVKQSILQKVLLHS